MNSSFELSNDSLRLLGYIPSKSPKVHHALNLGPRVQHLSQSLGTKVRQIHSRISSDIVSTKENFVKNQTHFVTPKSCRPVFPELSDSDVELPLPSFCSFDESSSQFHDTDSSSEDDRLFDSVRSRSISGSFSESRCITPQRRASSVSSNSLSSFKLKNDSASDCSLYYSEVSNISVRSVPNT
ncbi:hypothetical protein RCL1_000367 [Eukaryota sp. TZLM3-RCL]